MKTGFFFFVILVFSLGNFRFTRKPRFYFQKKLYRRIGLFINFSGTRFSSISGWYFKEAVVKFQNGNRVFLSSFTIKVSIWEMLKHSGLLSSVKKIQGNGLIIIPGSSQSNNNLTTHPKTNNSWEKARAVLEKAIYSSRFYNPATTIGFENISIHIRKRSKVIHLKCRHFLLKNSIVQAGVQLNALNHQLDFCMNGNFNKDGNNCALDLEAVKFSDTGNDCEIIQTSRINLSFDAKCRTEANLTFKAEEVKLSRRVSSFDPGNGFLLEGNLGLLANAEQLEIKKGSAVSINEHILLVSNIIFSRTEPDLVKFSFIAAIDGENFFDNYPFFSLNALKKIKAKGELVIKINCILSLTNVLNYHFDCQLIENTFGITDAGIFAGPGADNYIFNNNALSNRIGIENVQLIKNNYQFLGDIPDLLHEIIVLNEDPNFYTHGGIDVYFIGVAIALNLKEKKFKKGASTITMQLVKNLFLTGKKNIFRKSDELIISWVVEQHLKLSKKHILEMYLNVIEFGNNLYGINAAAKFYFSKVPSQLSTLECIVISYIIPRPRFFLEAVQIQSDQLKQNLKQYIDYNIRALEKQGIISQTEVDSSPYFIEFSNNIGSTAL